MPGEVDGSFKSDIRFVFVIRYPYQLYASIDYAS
jgi:hypothetical protein